MIETRLHEIGAMLAAIEAAHATPRERLKALFGALAEQSALIARHGCPHGSLCLELGKRADGPGLAAELIRVPLTGRNASSRPWAAPTRATSRSRSSPGTRAPRC